MFIISVNYGTKQKLYLFCRVQSEMGQHNAIYLKIYFQSCTKIKLATLIEEEFLFPGHVWIIIYFTKQENECFKNPHHDEKKRYKKVLKLFSIYHYYNTGERERE